MKPESVDPSSVEAAEGVSPDDAPERPFDSLDYIQSSVRERKDLRKLPDLALAATRLAKQASPRLFYLNIGVQLSMALLLGVQVLLGKFAIQAVLDQANGGKLGPALAPLIGLVAATAVGGLAVTAQVQLERLLGERVQRLTWRSILDVTTNVPLDDFEGPGFFDALQRVKANALLRPLTLTQGLVLLAGGVLTVGGLAISLVLIEPLIVPILLVGSIPLWVISRKTGREEFEFRAGQTPQLRLREYLTSLLTGRAEAKEIRAFNLGPVLRGRWEGNYGEYLEDYGRHVKRRLWLGSVGALITTVSTSVALGLLLVFVVKSHISVAQAGAALIAIRLMTGRVQQIFVGISDLFESGLFLRDLDAFTERRAEANGSTRTQGARVAGPFKELVVEDLWFRYPGSHADALRGVSLTIKAGEVIALVGENGSGKTTLAKLLAGLFVPSSGRILWDGVDTRQLDPASLRENVGVIFQDFVRYQLTARENVEFGRPEARDGLDAVARAAKLGGADQFLEQLPDGYETSLGKEYEGGHDLSVGQWQRVALARAFFRDAPFLVLDEPTASLDARWENALFEQVQGLAAGRSQLLISHRFSTVKSADRIYVLHGGELVEQGTHAELMRHGGLYAELFDLQANAYR